ncbi:MAG: carbohydrate ABC transporter permease [Actinomycetota bacterium]|nr:carbohydrate ABC transporter permease [Actinomycetota bacterium]
MKNNVSTNRNPFGIRYMVSKRMSIGIRYLILVIIALFFLFPTVFMFVSSIKNNETQIISDMSNLRAFVPYGDIGFKNYFDVFTQLRFARFMFNSLFIVGTIVFAGLIVNSMIAYSLARLRFRGRNIIISLIIALIIVPVESIVIPLLLMVNKVGWIDSYHVQIIPFIADAFSIFLFYQFFIDIPTEIDEAAIVDGASSFRVYWNIIIPLSLPVFATVAILQFLFRWNDFLWPLMVTRGYEYRPLTVAIQQLFTQAPKMWGDIFAFASMITIPSLTVFLVFQKWFVRSIASSSIKG